MIVRAPLEPTAVGPTHSSIGATVHHIQYAAPMVHGEAVHVAQRAALSASHLRTRWHCSCSSRQSARRCTPAHSPHPQATPSRDDTKKAARRHCACLARLQWRASRRAVTSHHRSERLVGAMRLSAGCYSIHEHHHGFGLELRQPSACFHHRRGRQEIENHIAAHTRRAPRFPFGCRPAVSLRHAPCSESRAPHTHALPRGRHLPAQGPSPAKQRPLPLQLGALGSQRVE